MPKIKFIAIDGAASDVEGEIGETVMEAAKRFDVSGIVAECGGGCSCATCHVYVDPAWMDATGPREPAEDDMLDSAFDVHENSRLSCQIVITQELDGLVLRVPPRQT